MCVELSTEGTSWNDFSDYLSVITPAPMTRDTGEQAVFGENLKIPGVGKRNPFEATIRGVYANGSTTADPFFYVWTQWQIDCGGPLLVRWAPAGCSTVGVTNQVFSTGTSTAHRSAMIGLTLPSGDADSGAPLMWEAVVRSVDVYMAAYA
jgi:hypothetical protein